jgi:hypothetical protein
MMKILFAALLFASTPAFADDASAFHCGVVAMGELDNITLHRAAKGTDILMQCLAMYPALVTELLETYNKGLLAAEKAR